MTMDLDTSFLTHIMSNESILGFLCCYGHAQKNIILGGTHIRVKIIALGHLSLFQWQS